MGPGGRRAWPIPTKSSRPLHRLSQYPIGRAVRRCAYQLGGHGPQFRQSPSVVDRFRQSLSHRRRQFRSRRPVEPNGHDPGRPLLRTTGPGLRNPKVLRTAELNVPGSSAFTPKPGWTRRGPWTSRSPSPAKGMILPVLTHKPVTLKYAAGQPLRLSPEPPTPGRAVRATWPSWALPLACSPSSRRAPAEARRLRVFRFFLAFTWCGSAGTPRDSFHRPGHGALKSLKAGQGFPVSSTTPSPCCSSPSLSHFCRLGTRHLLRLAVPLRRIAGIRGHRGEDARGYRSCASLALAAAGMGALRRCSRRWWGGALPAAPRREPERGGTLQDGHHRGVRPNLALRDLRRPLASGRRFFTQAFCRFLCPTGA